MFLVAPPFIKKAVFVPFSQDLLAADNGSTVAIPSGASQVTIECVGRGGNGLYTSPNARGGGGGGYSRAAIASLAGYTGIHIQIDSSLSQARQNNSSGTVLCRANAGGNAGTISAGSGASATGAVGSLIRTGGNGGTNNAGSAGGGGAGGPSANGGSSSTFSPGVGGGSPGGDGGSSGGAGQDYGGGGSSTSPGVNGNGGAALIRLSWT